MKSTRHILLGQNEFAVDETSLRSSGRMLNPKPSQMGIRNTARTPQYLCQKATFGEVGGRVAVPLGGVRRDQVDA